MKRQLVIEEQFTIYTVKRGDAVLGSGTTLEKALDKATRDKNPPASMVYDAAEVIESLLGPRQQESELVTT